MNGRDGRHDSGDFDDADWLLSQLGNGRRPDLEGRTTPPEPVAPEPFAPPAPAEPVSPPPGDRARRRSEESLDWFSLAEPAGETDAVTRALPVVGEPIQRQEPEPQQAPPAWNQPAWNQPAWNEPAHPAPPRVPAPPGGSERLTSVEPPVGSPVPPAFGGPPATPATPPGPVTPPASFALTWGEQPIDSEDGLRAAFRQLSEPAAEARHDEPRRDEPPHWEPEPPRAPEPAWGDRSDDAYAADARDRGTFDDGDPGETGAAPRTPADQAAPFAGFTPPPVARQSFTPVPPTAPPAFPQAGADYDDELWSALTEDETPRDEQRWDDDAAAGDGGDWRDHVAGSGGRNDGPGWDDDGRHGGYDDRGYDRAADGGGFDPGLYADANASSSGYDDRGGYDGRSGYDDRGGYDPQAYDDRGGYDDREDPRNDARSGGDRWDDGDAGAPWPPEWQDSGRDANDDVRWYADEVAERERRRQAEPTADDRFRDDWAPQPVDERSRDEWAPDGDRRDAAPWEREGDGSPMAQELAQTGYFWNLTPDPSGRDPKAEPEDEGSGPRRRSGADPAPARDEQPFGADTYASVPRYGDHDGPATDDGYAEDPFARFAQDEVDAHSGDRHDPYAAETGAYVDPFAPNDDPYGDRRDDRRPTEPGTETGDGLAALFGGSGFGVTGPMGVVPAEASARTAPGPDARPDRFDPRDDPFARDPFGRDDRYDAQYARDDRYARDDYGRPAGGGSTGTRPAQEVDGGGRSPVKVLAWIAGALAVVLLVVGGFALVTRVIGGGGASEQSASDAGGTVDLPDPTAMQAPGVYPWNQLFGGECLEPFQDAWAEEFTVVDCAVPHAAQLVLRGEVSTDQAAAFPGEAEVAAQVAQLCAAEGVIDPAAVGDVTDLQMQASYPVTEEQWTSGDRTFYCFVNRASGEPLAVGVQGAGPQA